MDTQENKLCLGDLIQVLDTMRVGLIITDRAGTVLWGNRYYSEVAKFPIAEYFGKNVREISRRENVTLPEQETMLDLVLRKKKEIHEVVKYNTDDYVITTVAPVGDPSGEPEFFLYTITNYSETLRMQKELSLSHARASALEEQLQELQFRKQLGEDVVVKDRAMTRIYQMGARLAFVDASVVILGESGVGKDVLAKFIHRSGDRKLQPFVHVNLGAIPKELFESQLFGYAPGAFTGAAKTGKLGLIRLADKGTLFLDEVGELPLDIQAKLLQVLQDKAVRAIGSTELVPVDVRVIAATNRNLAEMVQSGTFRLDLYYRLNVIELKIPPLRQRRDEIPYLAARFLQEFNQRYETSKEFSPEVLESFRAYPWPGNIRELRHVVESLVVLGQDPIITAEQLPVEFRESRMARRADPAVYGDAGLKTIMAHLERQILKEALDKYPTAGAAADYLKIDPSTLAKKRKRYGI
ncbi:sigma-54 interaction domain-containing protein [Pseudoflavonifractor phocaeensis]|uniref:sigma-54 interaction domain-containing protein n=1 Tax=Pseudoflavonifractor phocaeensis TaxID=1870988 RepID=UPI0019578787|nr:sigma 54-interacting transcriptional regulator [Pseudoflavonifractor phocaeensis]